MNPSPAPPQGICGGRFGFAGVTTRPGPCWVAVYRMTPSPKEPGNMGRHLSLLKSVKWPFAGAFACGIIYAVSSGIGLPFMASYIFPRIFQGEAWSKADQKNPPVLTVIVTGPGAELAKVKAGDTPIPADSPGQFSQPLTEITHGKPVEVAIPSGPSLSTVQVAVSKPRAEMLGKTEILLICLLFPLVFLLRGVTDFGNAYLGSYCGMRILEDLRLRVFAKLQRLPMSFFGEQSRGDLLSRVMQDAQNVQTVLSGAANDLLKEPLTLVGGLISLFYLAWDSGQFAFVLFCIIVVPLCILPVRHFGKRVFKRAVESLNKMGRLTETLNENLGAVREIRAFGLEEQQSAKFQIASREYFDLNLKVYKYLKLVSPVVEFAASLGISMAIYYAAGREMRLGDVIPLMFALQICYEPIKKLSRVHSELKRGVASLERIEEILAADETVADKPGAAALGHLKGRLVFEKVNFHYKPSEPVLRDFSATLEAGKVYALVGPTGSGKTTLAGLVLRFFDPVSGRVTVDGHDLRDIRVDSLRRQIAFVPQKPYLFNETLRENIALSRPGATQAEIEHAAQRAQAHDFISGFALGYDSRAGEGGGSLSGGQAQRVAIARAFLRDAPILILDEATSALDSGSEEKVQQALAEVVKGRTVLLIAHRFSTLKIADEILVLEGGCLVDQGPHDVLMGRCGLYRELYNKQVLA